MATIKDHIAQQPSVVRRGQTTVLSTVVRLTGASDTVELPNMAASSNSAAQLRRPGDSAVTVSQSDINSVSVTGGTAGQEVLIVSLHQDPIVNG